MAERSPGNGIGVLYRTIVADPPWHYDSFGGFNQAGSGKERVETKRRLPYPSMSVAEIVALPVADLAHTDGANLFLWTTNRYLPDAFDVLRAWGATYRQIIVWHKTGANPNTGAVAPTSCEFLLFARIGKGARLTGKLVDAAITTKRVANRHSRKPDGFLDEIERVSPGPHLELFARRNRFGWDTWGNEALNHVEMPGEPCECGRPTSVCKFTCDFCTGGVAA